MRNTFVKIYFQINNYFTGELLNLFINIIHYIINIYFTFQKSTPTGIKILNLVPIHRYHSSIYRNNCIIFFLLQLILKAHDHEF